MTFDDLRFAFRLFARRRRFSILLVATLALGIGSATAIFSLVDGVLWKPLPYHDPDRLYWIARTNDAWRASPVLAHRWNDLAHALPHYAEWAAAQRSFEETGAWFLTTGVLTSDHGAEQIPVGRATSSLVPLLGARPTLGRWFLPGEDGAAATRRVVLSHAAWQSRFGGDTAVLGRTVTLNGAPHDVIGVLPARFRMLGEVTPVELWAPAGSAPGVDWTRDNHNFSVIGRLRPFTAPESAADEARRLLAVDERGEGIGIRMEPVQSEITRHVRAPLRLLLWSALLLLVIACGNVAILLLGEGSARDDEIATRLAIGARRGRIVRQLLTENLLLGVVGGAIGVLLATAAVRALRVVAPSDIPRIETAQLDFRGATFALVLTLLTAVVFSLSPVVAVVRKAPGEVLRAGRGRLTSPRGLLQRWGVLVQCALVIVLLAGAALLVRTHQALLAVDPGFRTGELLSVQLRLFGSSSRYRDAAARRVLFDRLVREASALPGVRAAAAGSVAPFQAQQGTTIHVAASPAVSIEDDVAGTYTIVAHGWFETLGIALRTGRLFDATDDAPGATAIVSESFARRFWPGASAVGQRIRVDATWREVVGVVGDVRHETLDEEPRPTFYLPAAQTERMLETLVLHTTGDPRASLPAVRALIAGVDPAIPVMRADRLSDLVAHTLVEVRFRTMLFVFFALSATVIAAVGVYGVATGAVAHRTRELAIRMAVGATPASVLRLMVLGMLGVAGGGVVIGLVAARAASRALRPFLHGVSAGDALSHVSVALLVLAVAIAAAWIPARRATRIELMKTLRTE
ncbi:MAG TPA: ABC transporter permease [Gemmatimonadaceae bacterium]|nr:ABC transporter permease [Gemmatimonadaceae bacterium]